MAHLLNEGFLEVCFQALKRNKACGIDGVKVEEYEVNLKENLKELVARMKALHYYPTTCFSADAISAALFIQSENEVFEIRWWDYPQPVRRVKIPKPDGKSRPLGISSVEDKIVQMGMTRILEAIFECDFCDSSYGFRPNRSCHSALDVLDKTIMTRPIHAIVDMDIEKFFDSIDHKWLMECLRQRITDPNFLRLIVRFLKAGLMEDGKYVDMEKGTAQGSILSPVLSNIYLHFILDLWFERVARKQFQGYARLIRYADDFVVCFEREDEAREFSEMLKNRLAKFGLKIAEGKSRVISFGRRVWEKSRNEGGQVASFDFLGFTPTPIGLSPQGSAFQ